MKKPFLLAAMSILSLAVSPAAAASPRTPTGKWVLEFAEDQCFAMRDYGGKGEPLFLAFKPAPTGKLMQIILVVREQAAPDAREAPVTIQIDGLPPITTRLLSFEGKAKGTKQIQINLPIENFAPMRQATSLSIVSKDDIDERFALKQMPALMAEMDRCLLDLQNVWNISETAKASMQSRAKANLANYFSSDDYPAIAWIKSKGGTVQFMLLIDESGRVADCMVTETSGVPVLDAQSCALLHKRARFTPATGVDGKPTKDSATSRVRWEMPSEGPVGATRIK